MELQGSRRNFYPRPPRGGRPTSAPATSTAATHFYPRPPRGGRPCCVLSFIPFHGHFYPRPPRGGRQVYEWSCKALGEISIHALREEGDRQVPLQPVRQRPISIHALREEGDRVVFSPLYLFTDISIHALREEGDHSLSKCPCGLCYFYPRPPRGGRPSPGAGHFTREVFLSTPSARRATRSKAQLQMS